MSLNIKNEQTHALVRQLAQRTGMSQTRAVEEAVRRMLSEIEHDASAERAHRERSFDTAIARLRALPTTGPSFAEINDKLYDENGLPR